MVDCFEELPYFYNKIKHGIRLQQFVLNFIDGNSNIKSFSNLTFYSQNIYFIPCVGLSLLTYPYSEKFRSVACVPS